jgi:hypothetical protein
MNFEKMAESAPHVLKNILIYVSDRKDAALVNKDFYLTVCEIERYDLHLDVSLCIKYLS